MCTVGFVIIDLIEIGFTATVKSARDNVCQVKINFLS